MYKGTKFNTRKEDVVGENYLGIQIFRFYMRCSTCAAEISFKTDPKNADYVCENGASRNYEPWREEDVAKAQTAAQREEEERGNAMKALENRTLDSKREMDILAALDEMRSLKARHEKVGIDEAIAALKRSAGADGEEVPDGPELEVDEEDEEALRRIFFASRNQVVKRLPSDGNAAGAASKPAAAQGAGGSGAQPSITAKPKVVVHAKKRAAPEPASVAPDEGGLAGLLGYGTGSSSGEET